VLRDKYFLGPTNLITSVKDGRTNAVHSHSSSVWSHSFAVSLEDALRINGYNEDYDGGFGDEDGDFGVRLFCSGTTFTVNTEIKGYELSYTQTHMGVGRIPIRHNHCLMLYLLKTLQEKHINLGHFKDPLPLIVRANESRPKIDQIEWLREKQKDIWKYKGISVPEHPYAWMFDVDVFDLKEMRRNRI
jgi:hypothetical protein